MVVAGAPDKVSQALSARRFVVRCIKRNIFHLTFLEQDKNQRHTPFIQRLGNHSKAEPLIKEAKGLWGRADPDLCNALKVNNRMHHERPPYRPATLPAKIH